MLKINCYFIIGFCNQDNMQDYKISNIALIDHLTVIIDPLLCLRKLLILIAAETFKFA